MLYEVITHSQRSVASGRAMNIAVAVALMVVAAIVMIASYRLGSGWAKDVGPDSGYFPFYIGLILFISSGLTLVQSIVSGRRDARVSFISRDQLFRVLQVLVPMTVFVVLSRNNFV